MARLNEVTLSSHEGFDENNDTIKTFFEGFIFE